MSWIVIVFRKQNWFLYVLNNGNFYNNLGGRNGTYTGWQPSLDMAPLQVNTVSHGPLKENIPSEISVVAVRV